MKLSKAFLNEMRTGINSLIGHMARMNGKTSLLQYVDNLYGHIEALEQELSEKPRFVSLNYKLICCIDKVCRKEPEGFIFEVVEKSKTQWLIVSGIYKGQLMHKEHASEFNIHEKLTELHQATLMHQENERVLMGQRAALNDKVGKLERQVQSLIQSANIQARRYKALDEEIGKVLNDNQKAHEERDLLFAQLEAVMLDQQPVVLPMEVAEAIDHCKSVGFQGFRIISCIPVISQLFRDYQASTIEALKVLSNFAFTRSDGEETLLKALVNGYTVEQKLTLPISEQLADMIQEWTNEPTFDDEDAACLKLANAIAERTKEFYSK